jgi:hypothetical protein
MQGSCHCSRVSWLMTWNLWLDRRDAEQGLIRRVIRAAWPREFGFMSFAFDEAQPSRLLRLQQAFSFFVQFRDRLGG